MAEPVRSLRDLQLAMVRHLREPSRYPSPEGFDPLRLEVYRNAVYRNVDEMISYNFPVIKSLYQDEAWAAMIREFMTRHRSETPLFAEVPPEFIAFLEHERDDADDPPFLVELAWHEWSESEVALDQRELDMSRVARDGDLLAGVPVLNPIHKQATYRYPVHRINSDYRPAQAPEQPTYIIVYRQPDYQIGFMELNPVTARLIELLSGPGELTGEAALRRIAAELEHPHPPAVIDPGRQILEQMRAKTIILGTRAAA